MIIFLRSIIYFNKSPKINLEQAKGSLPVSKKPTEVRMGKGKGAPEYYACRVKPGRIIFEVDGIDEATARIALYKASTKLHNVIIQ